MSKAEWATYMREWRLRNRGHVNDQVRARYALRHPPKIPECHPDRKHGALGLCESCYQVAWRKKAAELRTEDEQKAYSAVWHERAKIRHQGYGRDRSYRQKYGITLKDYEAMYLAQKGCCAL